MPSANGHIKEHEGRLPPQNVEAEDALLGSLLINNEAIHEVSVFLQPEHFYRVSNRWIYEAILVLSNHNEPIDVITLCDELKNKKQLDDLGGETEIIRLLNCVPTSINADHYGRIIEEMAVRRGMIVTGSKIANMGHDTKEDVQEQLIKADGLLLNIRNGRMSDQPPRPRKYASEWLDRIDRLRSDEKQLLGLPSPWIDLNRILLGFIDGRVYYVGARPAMGKSSMLINLAAHWTLEHGKRGLLWSGEMDTNQILDRIAAEQTRIPLKKVRMGDLTNDEHTKTTRFGGMIGDGGLIIDETPGINPAQLRAICHREYMIGGLDYILVDYIGLMTPDRYLNSKNQELTEISQSLVALARSLKVPVIAASQLNRSVETRADKRPNLSDLRDSGSLEQDAYAVIFLYRDDYYNELTEHPNITEVIIPKHRDGPTGVADLYWNGQLTAFRNLQRQEIVL